MEDKDKRSHELGNRQVIDEVRFTLSHDKEVQTEISGNCISEENSATKGMYLILKCDEKMLNFYTGMPNNDVYLYWASQRNSLPTNVKL